MRNISYRIHILAALIAGALISHTTHAGDVPALTNFTDGTPAKAADVNGNFTAIKDAVNANNTRLGTLETTVADMPAGATGATGPAGPAGPTGATGPAGPAGPAGSTPAGAVNFFATAACPAGWVMANGATVARASFPELFAAIGTEFGVGDGSTTFGLPELRGEFLRALDSGRGVDVGRALGSPQSQDWKTFSVAGFTNGTYTHADVLIPKSGYNTEYPFGGFWQSPGNLLRFQWDATSEVRPRNVALLACIKR